MLKDNINFGAKGHVIIKGIKPDGKEVILVDKKNALYENAKTIITYLLGGQSSYAIDKIYIYKLGVLLATSTFVTKSYPSTTSIKFTARFSESSFNDTLDEIRLGSTIGGQFSQLGDLAILKDNTLQLQIEWLLTINSL